MSYESVVSSLAPVGRWKLDETSGNAIDSIGGNDGTFGAGITQGGEPAVAGGSSYEGSGASTALIKADTGITAYPYTMAVWFKSTTVSDTILSLGSKSVAEYTDIRLTGTGQLNLRTLDSGGGSNVNATNAANANDGEWHLIVAVLAADNSKTIYYDAEDGSENTSTRVFPTGDVELAIMGRPSGTSATALDGHTSEALLFDKALTATEVQSLYLAGRPPVLRYKLELSASAIDSALTSYATRVGTASISTAENTALFSTDTGSGADVWFSSDEAGTLPIDGKLVYWDDATSKFAFDVEITSVSAVSGATIYLQVGSKPGGYGTDAYRAARHHNLPLAGDLDDVTAYNRTTTESGGITAGGLTGPDGHTPATDFDGTDDEIAITDGVDVVNGSAYNISMWVDPDVVGTGAALRGSGGGVTITFQPNVVTDGVVWRQDGDTLVETAGDRSSSGWYHIAFSYDGADRITYVNGTQVATDSPGTLTTGSTALTVGGTSNNYNGGMAGYRADTEALSAAEINADYLLQGSTASSYWTVTDVTPGLPEATFDLRSDREVVLSGSDVTSWGNASGGTSPTYSADPADKVLGFPAIQFDGSSSQYLEWDEIASMFSGDYPDYTAAVLIRPKSEAGAKSVLAVFPSTGNMEILRVSGVAQFLTNRNDGVGGLDSMGAGTATYGNTYLALVKLESGVSSLAIYNVSDGSLHSSNSASWSASGVLTMVDGRIGGSRTSGSYEGDIARIRLYNTALGGDLTGDLTGTQLGQLKDEMLASAPSGFLSELHYAISGIGVGVVP